MRHWDRRRLSSRPLIIIVDSHHFASFRCLERRICTEFHDFVNVVLFLRFSTIRILRNEEEQEVEEGSGRGNLRLFDRRLWSAP